MSTPTQPDMDNDTNAETARDLSAVIFEAHKTRPIRKRIFDSGLAIEEQPGTIKDADFLHSVLCQVGMPRKAITERYFERRSGHVHIRLNAGTLWDGEKWVEKPVPYGVVPRLVMIYICTVAIRTQYPTVEIGRSIHEFMKMLGRQTNSRAYATFRLQVEALAACELALGMNFADQKITLKTNPIKEFRAWFSNDGSDPKVWEGSLRLSDEFFSTLKNHAVPLDMRALKSVRHSPLAIDIYTWLAYRLCQIKRSEGIKVTWPALQQQFGQEYSNLKDFKKAFNKALHQVLSVYPEAKITSAYGGLLLHTSPPPVGKQGTLM